MSDEKKTESIMVRVSPAILARVEAAAIKSGLKSATLARMGLIEVADRINASAPEMAPEIACAVAQARARGIDVTRVLTDALEAKLAADATAPTPAAAA